VILSTSKGGSTSPLIDNKTGIEVHIKSNITCMDRESVIDANLRRCKSNQAHDFVGRVDFESSSHCRRDFLSSNEASSFFRSGL